MARIDLHIGTHKTGTSTIQQWLDRNQTALLRQGILYPLSGRPRRVPDAQHALAWSLRGIFDQRFDDHWPTLLKEIEKSDAGHAIISSEDFDFATDEQVRRIREVLEKHDVRIVVYLRNPRAFLTSAFTQQVKSSTRWSGTPRQFLEKNLHRCNYPLLLNRWANMFGKSQVQPRLFDGVDRRGGLLADFAAATGIDVEEVDTFDVETQNTKPRMGQVETLLALNRLEKRMPSNRVCYRLFYALRNRVREATPIGRCAELVPVPRIDPQIYSDAELDELRRTTNAWNESLFGEYFPDEDRPLLLVAAPGEAHANQPEAGRMKNRAAVG